MGVLHLIVRDTVGDIENAGSNFSSWDKCMQKSYCKWPAIIGIVIGSLIVISVIFCLARCLCCGLECCCGCFSCLNHCCPSGNRRKSKYGDGQSRFQPNPYHGYQPAPYAPPAYEAPQYAQFDAPTKNGQPDADALPAMPSWDHASSKRVEDPTAGNDMEMGNMNRHSGQALGSAAATGQSGSGHYNPVGSNPGSPYVDQPGGYRGTDNTHPYGGDIGAQSAHQPDYNYGRPASSQQDSYPSQQTAPYNGQHTSPTSQNPPFAGFRAPASEDRFQPSAIAPTPGQYQSGYNPQAPPQQNAYTDYSSASSTRYEPTTYHGQETGMTGPSPVPPHDQRPPSILQAGRKPIQGSWRDV